MGAVGAFVEAKGKTKMRTLIVAAVAAIGMTGIAIADVAKGPAVMTDAQMDLVVAGAGNILHGSPAAGGIPPWFALINKAGFTPTHVDAGTSGIVVLVPR